MEVVVTKAELKQALTQIRSDNFGEENTVALVMTMGALHDGHIRLIKAAKLKAQKVVVSIYVNPLQFGPNEDYLKYPRTLEADLLRCKQAGVDVVFAPSDEQMYGITRQITLKVGILATIFEGKTRPGHFDGVCQVVCKVLNLVKPDYAFFGQKDAQQLAVIKNMVHDLDMDVEICAIPIVREENGLAMSSRNVYLSEKSKQKATLIYKTLETAKNKIMWGSSIADTVDFCKQKLSAVDGIELDYFEIVDPFTFAESANVGQKLVICAAKVDGTRLIDNLLIEDPLN